MKRLTRYSFIAFLMLSFLLFLHRGNITRQPWLAEQPLEWIGSASGNGETIAIIADGARTVVVLNNEGELLYKVQAGMDTARSFVSAELAELDGENNLYVYDKQFSGAFQENTERVLKYSSTGEFLSVVYTYSYINEDFIITKGKISGMATYGDTLYLARLEHDGFYLETISSGENGESLTHTFFEYPAAFRELSYCRLNTRNQRITWTTKTGTILLYDFSGLFIKEIAARDDISPYMTASDNDGNLVYTDILNCEVALINGRTGKKTTLFQRPMSEGNFYFYISSNNNKTYLSYNADDVLVIDADGACTNISSYRYSDYDQLARKILFSFCVAGIILLVFMLFRGLLFVSKQKPSGVLKQIMLVGICIILGAAISSLIIVREMQKQNNESTFGELEKISRLMSASMDISIVNKLKSSRDFDSEEYLAFSEHIKAVFSELPFEGKQVYLIIWMERDGIVYSMYDLEYSWGTFYPYGYYEGSFLEDVYVSKEYTHMIEGTSSGTWVNVQGPIFDKNGEILAVIETGYNMHVVEEENRTMMIQLTLIVLATTVAFLLIVIECLLMFDAYKKNKSERTGNSKTELKPNMLKCVIALLMNAYRKDDDKNNVAEASPKLAGPVIGHLINSYKSNFSSVFHPELIRAAAFFMYFAVNFATALLPMYAASLYVPVYNLPREFVITLPFTAQMVCVVLSLLLIPAILEKAGIRKISLVSAILFFAGNVLCVMAENIIHLSAAYALLGLSCGSFVLIFNTIIGSQKNAADMNSGFAHFNASYLAGVNVGVVFGSIIAQFFPYRTVFWFASGIALLFLLIIVFSLRSKLVRHYYDVQYNRAKTMKKFALAKFMCRPIVICVMLLALMPYVISMSFMEYFMPVFGTDNGLGEANIGQLMLLSGLFAILLSATLCQLMSKKMPMLLTVLFPLALNAGAIYVFSLNVSISMLIVTVVLLAIVNIFALTNIQTYYTLLYQAARIHSVKALGALSVVENTAMAIGPIVFSYILASDIGTGMKLLAAAMLGCTVVFLLVSLVSVKWNFDTLEKISESDRRKTSRAAAPKPLKDTSLFERE